MLESRPQQQQQQQQQSISSQFSTSTSEEEKQSDFDAFPFPEQPRTNVTHCPDRLIRSNHSSTNSSHCLSHDESLSFDDDTNNQSSQRHWLASMTMSSALQHVNAATSSSHQEFSSHCYLPHLGSLAAAQQQQQRLPFQPAPHTMHQSAIASHRTLYLPHFDEYERDHDHELPYTQAMIAGASAGVMEHLFMFPVDTIKTRLQTSLQYTSIRDCVTRMAREEGLSRLYRGVTAVVIGAVPSHALHYSSYEFLKQRLGGNSPGHHPIANGVSGALATCLHDAVITPLDVVKQRLQLYQSDYLGVKDCIKSIIAKEGVATFYASYPTTVAMNVPFMTVHFSAYESFKLIAMRLSGREVSGIQHELAAGACAGAAAGALSTPLDVIKTRIQTQTRVRGVTLDVSAIVREIYLRDGAAGFFRGASARVLYHMPSAAICWTTYETVKRLLKGKW